MKCRAFVTKGRRLVRLAPNLGSLARTEPGCGHRAEFVARSRSTISESTYQTKFGVVSTMNRNCFASTKAISDGSIALAVADRGFLSISEMMPKARPSSTCSMSFPRLLTSIRPARTIIGVGGFVAFAKDDVPGGIVDHRSQAASELAEIHGRRSRPSRGGMLVHRSNSLSDRWRLTVTQEPGRSN
jgi:hypothetical protein